MTLSRSTLTKTCGTFGKKVGISVPSSGRLLAASKNVFRFCARNPTSLPARSSSINVNPPEVPTPGIGGGGNAKAIPSLRVERYLFRRALIAGYCSSGFVRSLQGLKVTKKNALYV